MAVTAPQVFLKTPTEERIYHYEIPQIDLADDEVITSAVFTSEPTGLTHVVWGTAVIVGRICQSKATGGAVPVGEDYQDYHGKVSIETTITSGGSQKPEYCFVLRVQEC